MRLGEGYVISLALGGNATGDLQVSLFYCLKSVGSFFFFGGGRQVPLWDKG